MSGSETVEQILEQRQEAAQALIPSPSLLILRLNYLKRCLDETADAENAGTAMYMYATSAPSSHLTFWMLP